MRQEDGSATGLIFFRGVFDLLDEFSGQMAAAAEKRGIQTLVLDSREDWASLAERIRTFHAQEGRCAAVLFNNIVLPLPAGERNLWEELEIPVYDLLVDHPINYDQYLRQPIRELRVGVVDRKHAEFVRKVYPEVRSVFFLPHGGIETEGHRPYAEREIDVLYTGMCQEERDYGALNFLPDQGVAFYRQVMEILLREPWHTTEEAVWRAIGELRLAPTPEQELLMLKDASVTSEWNMRRVYKLEILRLLGEAGIRVEVIGDHYEDPDIVWPENIHFRPPVTMEECRRLTGNAKISLNIMPWFKDGGHDRVFNAMLNGAVSVTDTTGYLQERFTHGRDIVFYDLADLPQLVTNVTWLLAHPDQAAMIAERGYWSALAHDQWANRLKDLLTIMEAEKEEHP